LENPSQVRSSSVPDPSHGFAAGTELTGLNSRRAQHFVVLAAEVVDAALEVPQSFGTPVSRNASVRGRPRNFGDIET
jgi:hypothetical protein